MPVIYGDAAPATTIVPPRERSTPAQPPAAPVQETAEAPARPESRPAVSVDLNATPRAEQSPVFEPAAPAPTAAQVDENPARETPASEPVANRAAVPEQAPPATESATESGFATSRSREPQEPTGVQQFSRPDPDDQLGTNIDVVA